MAYGAISKVRMLAGLIAESNRMSQAPSLADSGRGGGEHPTAGLGPAAVHEHDPDIGRRQGRAQTGHRRFGWLHASGVDSYTFLLNSLYLHPCMCM